MRLPRVGHDLARYDNESTNLLQLHHCNPHSNRDGDRDQWSSATGDDLWNHRKLSQTHLYRQLYIIYLLNSSVLECVCRLLLRWYLLAHYYVLGIFQYRRDASNTVISNVSHIPLYSPIVPENCLYAKLFLWFAPRGFEPAALA